MIRFLLLAFLYLYGVSVYCSDFGHYVGRVVAAWDPDGRTMVLTERFIYVDPNGIEWAAPVGSKIDGASIPQFAWSLIQGPYEDKFREASVIHDVACDQRTRHWRDTHHAFYTGMLASGVNAIKAKIMFAAVFHFGPRWERRVTLEAQEISKANSIVKDIASTARKGEQTSVNIRPGPGTPQPCPNCAVPLPDLPSKTADISVTFIPEVSEMSRNDMELLVQEIEIKELSLTAIEEFKPEKTKH